MRRTKEWWARLTPEDRKTLVHLERAQAIARAEWPDLTKPPPPGPHQCYGCNQDPTFWPMLCQRCYHRLRHLIAKADEARNWLEFEIVDGEVSYSDHGGTWLDPEAAEFLLDTAVYDCEESLLVELDEAGYDVQKKRAEDGCIEQVAKTNYCVRVYDPQVETEPGYNSPYGYEAPFSYITWTGDIEVTLIEGD